MTYDRSARWATRFGFHPKLAPALSSGRPLARQKPDQNFSALTPTFPELGPWLAVIGAGEAGKLTARGLAGCGAGAHKPHSGTSSGSRVAAEPYPPKGQYRWLVPTRGPQPAVAVENRSPGTRAWRLSGPAADVGGLRRGDVSGYVAEETIRPGQTQRLYVRQNYMPIFEGPVTIRDPAQPIGSFVYTALGYDNGQVRWNVVSMYRSVGRSEPPSEGQRHKSETAPADVTGAKAALDRITIPKDVVDRLSEVVLPGASLIISDEGASIETGKDTDFVVLMSGEPQGGIKTRHVVQSRYREDDD